MATSGINADALEAALYKALYPREARKYQWEGMKNLALAADNVETYSGIIVKYVQKVAREVLEDINTEYRSPEAGR